MDDRGSLKDVKLVPVKETWWQALVRRLRGEPIPLEFVERKRPKE